MLMVGIPDAGLDEDARRALRELQPGGLILFGRNLETPAALASLVEETRGLLPSPYLLAVDQEGGRVSRLEPWIGPTPTAADLAEKAGDRTYRLARALGSALRSLGFNLDFAPVVDLCAADAPNGIGDRSYGTCPDGVVHVARSFLDGLQQEGVAGCLKHFPGLGDTRVDSHESLPTVERDLARLQEQDLLPFRRLGSRAAAVMVGHGHYPALDPEAGLPASLSGIIVGRWLKSRLGFRGLVVSDDLEMGAVSPLDDGGRAAVAALAAGCDLVLYCSDLDRARRAREALAEAAADPSFARRLERAALSVTRTAARWPAPRPDLAAWETARAGVVEACRG